MIRCPTACLLALASLLAVAGPSGAQNARTWILDDNPEMAVLLYGAPESDDIVISFSCDAGTKQMLVSESLPSQALTPGNRTTFKLTAGTTSLDLTGDALASEGDGAVSIEVANAPIARVLALLKAGSSLEITLPGAKETLPLGNASPHLATFERLCAFKK